MKRSIIIYLLLFFAMNTFYAADNVFKVFDTSDGLPDNTVKCITQDSLGFIWMGTFNGLCRFDGKEFITYRHNPADENSIANNHMEALLATGADLWIGTENGLNRYDFAKDCFHPCHIQTSEGEKQLSSPVRNIIDCGGIVLVRTATGELLAHQGRNLFAACDFGKDLTYLTIAPYKDHLFWAYATDGLYLLNAQKKTIADWIPMANPFTYNYDLYNMYYSPATETLFVGSGIGRKGEAFKITPTGTAERRKDFRLSDIKAAIDYKGKTVFGLDGGGLAEWADNKLTHLTPQNSSISSDAIHTLFVDKEERLWAGTYRGGVNLHSPTFGHFHTLNMPTAHCPTTWSPRSVRQKTKSTSVWTEAGSISTTGLQEKRPSAPARTADWAGTMSCPCAPMGHTSG